MSSVITKVKVIRDLLLDLKDIDVFHYRKPEHDKSKRYVIWAEDGSSQSFKGNNRVEEQQITGSIDLFTQIEYDEIVDSIQDALNTSGHVSWRLDSVEYEDETALIHWAWTFSVA